MKRLASVTCFAGGGALLLLAGAGHAQVNDHLKCYKIKDPLKLKGVVDIDTPQFGLEKGCKIGDAEFFCVPATKHVIRAFDNKQPINPLDVFGPPAAGDRICYEIDCGNPRLARQQVTDQFGSRVISKLDPELLCTPAFKGSPPPTNCSDTFPTCGGTCPTGTVCTSSPIGCDCTPPPPTECGNATAPTCDGACPAGQICRISAAGCSCVTPPTECGNTTAPTCNGVCSAGTICRATAASGCTCVPPPTECGTSAPTCNGLCPPGQSCSKFASTNGTVTCDCQPVPQPCGLQTGGACDGACPSPQNCVPGTDPNAPCRCASPCGRLAGTTNVCGGDCNPGETCTLVTTTVPPDCRCAPATATCGLQANGQCGGTCPVATQTCTQDPSTNACGCH